jgi:hypothetical protein
MFFDNKTLRLILWDGARVWSGEALEVKLQAGFLFFILLERY